MTVQKLTIQVGSAHTRTVSSNVSGTFFAVGLPPGLSISSTGVISGTPTTPGIYTSTVFCVARKNVGVAVLDYTVIAVPVPVITSSDDQTRETGVSTTYQVTATSALPILSYAASNLFSGLSINPTTGLISGTPPTSVSEDALIRHISRLSAISSAGTGQRDILFRFQQRPVITSSLTNLNLTAEVAMTPYTITASKSPITFSATNLPTGLSLDTNTGIISGTPPLLTPGLYSVSISADNGQLIGSNTLPITVNQAPVITSSSTSTSNYLQNYTYQIIVSAYPPPSSYSATNLPTGITLNSSSGLISGQVSAPPYGSISVGLSATNSVGAGNATLSLTNTGIATNLYRVRKIGTTYFAVSTPSSAGPWYSYTSTDKINWTKNTINQRPTNPFVGVVYTGSEWAYVATGIPGLQLLKSSDGVNWTYTIGGGASNIPFVQGNFSSYFSGKYLVFSSGDSGIWSSNGTTWSNITGIPFNAEFGKAVSTGGVALRAGSNASGTNAGVSSDGINWSYFNIDSPAVSISTYSAGGGVFLAFPSPSGTSTYYRSTNGSTWTTHSLPVSINYVPVLDYVDGRFWLDIVFTNYSSSDGITWTNSTPFAQNVPSNMPNYELKSLLDSSVDRGSSGEVAIIEEGSGPGGGLYYPFKTHISNAARNSWTSSNLVLQ